MADGDRGFGVRFRTPNPKAGQIATRKPCFYARRLKLGTRFTYRGSMLSVSRRTRFRGRAMPADSQDAFCPICIKKVTAIKAYVNWYCPTCITVLNDHVLKAWNNTTSEGEQAPSQQGDATERRTDMRPPDNDDLADTGS